MRQDWRSGCTTTTRRSSVSRPTRSGWSTAWPRRRCATPPSTRCRAPRPSRSTASRTKLVLDVLDDGNGFDVDAQLADPEPGHFGLQLLADLAATGGALLQVASVPRAGTHWRLRVPQDCHAPSRRREPHARADHRAAGRRPPDGPHRPRHPARVDRGHPRGRPGGRGRTRPSPRPRRSGPTWC